MDGVMDVAEQAGFAELTKAFLAADVDLEADGAEAQADAAAQDGVDGAVAADDKPAAEGEKPEGDGEKDAGDEPEPGGDDGVELLAGIPEKSKAKINDRFAQLTARAKTAEEKAEAQAAELEELRALSSAAETGRAAGAALESAADSLRDWLDEHGPEDEFEENGKTYSFAQVKQALRNSERELSRTIPRAREALKLRTAAKAAAVKLYPNVLKAGTPEATEARRLLAAVPGLRALPNWPVLVGRMIAGRALEGKPKAAVVARPPRAPVGPGAAAAARGAAKTGAAVDLSRIEKSDYDVETIAEETYAKALA